MFVDLQISKLNMSSNVWFYKSCDKGGEGSNVYPHHT